MFYYNRLLLTFTISFTGRLGLPAATSGTLVQQWNFRDTLTYAGTFVLHVMIWGKQIHLWRLIQLYIAHYICSQLTFLDKEFLFAYCMFYFSYWMFCMTFKLGDDDETEWPYKPWGYTCAYRYAYRYNWIDKHIQEYNKIYFSQRKWQEGLCKGWKVNRVVSVETCLERELISLEELSFHLTLTWGLIRCVNIISFYPSFNIFFYVIL